jgi:hypothetical protein
MREHEPVNVRLPPLRPFAVVLANHLRAVPEDIRYLLEGRALL